MAVNQTPLYSPQGKGLSSPPELQRYGAQLDARYGGPVDPNQSSDHEQFQLKERGVGENFFQGLGHGGLKAAESVANFIPDVLGSRGRWATFSDNITDNKHSAVFQVTSDIAQLGVGLIGGGPLRKGFQSAVKGIRGLFPAGAKKVAKKAARRGALPLASKAWNIAREGGTRGAIAEMLAFRGGEEHLLLSSFFEKNPDWESAYEEATSTEGWANEPTVTTSMRLQQSLKNIMGRAAFAAEGALLGAAANFLVAAGKASFRAATKNTDRAMLKALAGQDVSGAAKADATEGLKAAKAARASAVKEAQEDQAFKEVGVAREEFEAKYQDTIETIGVKERMDTPAVSVPVRNTTLVPDSVDDVYRDITTPEGINKQAYANKTGPDTTREAWEKTLKVEFGYRHRGSGTAALRVHIAKEAPDIVRVDEDLIRRDWEASGRGAEDFTQGANFNARAIFDNVDEFQRYLIEVEKAKRLFPKMSKESAKDFNLRNQRHAVNEAKRQGWGHFYKYEFDAPQKLKHLELTKAERDIMLFKEGSGEAGDRLFRLIAGVDKAGKAVKTSPHAILTAAENVLRMDTAYSDHGMKYFQGRVMSLFMTGLRKNITKISDKKTMADAIGYMYDPKGSDLASILSDTMMDGIEELATSNGMDRRAMMHRLLKGRGNFRHLYGDLTEDSVFDFGKKLDVAAMKEMNVRIMAYRLEQAISMKKYRDITRQIAETPEHMLPGSDILKDYIVELERVAARVEGIQKLSQASGRALRAWHDLNDASMSGIALSKEIANFGGLKKLKANAQRNQALFDGADDTLSGTAAASDALTKSSFIDMHNEYWINSILSGTKTQMVNTISTGMHMYYKPMEGILGSLQEPEARRAMIKTLVHTAMINAQVTRVLGKLGLNKLKRLTKAIDEPQYLQNRKDIFSPEGDPTSRLNQAKGAIAGARKSFRTGEGTLTKGADLFDVVPPQAIGRNSLGEGASEVAKATLDSLGSIIRIPSRLMIGTDELFKQISFRASAMGQLASDGYELAVKKNLYPDADYIAGYIGEHFHGIIRASGASHTKKNILQEGRNAFKKEVTDAADQLRPFEKTEKEFLDTYQKKHYSAIKEKQAGNSLHWAEDVTFTRRLDADLQELKDLGVSPTARSSWTQDIQEIVHQHPWMRLIMPFIKTPLNIMKWPLQRMSVPGVISPNGKAIGREFEWVKKIHLRYQADMATGDSFRMAQASGRIAAGRFYWLGFSSAAASGVITGSGPSNPRERMNLMATGWRPYSVKIGDYYVSYSRLDPFSTALGLAADVYEKSEQLMRHGDVDENWAQATMLAGAYSLSNNLADKSYLAGINSVLQATIDPEKYFPKLLKKQITSYIPKIVSQWTPMLDDNHIKKTYGILEGAMGRLPGASKGIEPMRNYMGEPLEAMWSPSVWASGLNPFLISKMKSDRVLEEIASLKYGFGPPTPRIKGDRHLDMRRFHDPDTGRSAFDRYQELIGQVTDKRGRNLRAAMTVVFNSDMYRNASLLHEAGTLQFAGTFRDPRVKMVRGVMARWRASAKQKTLDEYPELKKAIKAFDTTVFEQLLTISGR
jgi:hypothetical protein